MKIWSRWIGKKKILLKISNFCWIQIPVFLNTFFVCLYVSWCFSMNQISCMKFHVPFISVLSYVRVFDYKLVHHCTQCPFIYIWRIMLALYDTDTFRYFFFVLSRVGLICLVPWLSFCLKNIWSQYFKYDPCVAYVWYGERIVWKKFSNRQI